MWKGAVSIISIDSSTGPTLRCINEPRWRNWIWIKAEKQNRHMFLRSQSRFCLETLLSFFFVLGWFAILIRLLLQVNNFYSRDEKYKSANVSSPVTPVAFFVTFQILSAPQTSSKSSNRDKDDYFINWPLFKMKLFQKRNNKANLTPFLVK